MFFLLINMNDHINLTWLDSPESSKSPEPCFFCASGGDRLRFPKWKMSFWKVPMLFYWSKTLLDKIHLITKNLIFQILLMKNKSLKIRHFHWICKWWSLYFSETALKVMVHYIGQIVIWKEGEEINYIISEKKVY